MNAADADGREAQRQRLLLGVLLGDLQPAALGGWLRGGAPVDGGILAYRGNAGAIAERALAAAFPTLQPLLAEPSFAVLARDFWRRRPPTAGDIGEWGGELPAFVAAVPSLADEPCLADVARLEWAVHVAERAADAAAVQGLRLLGSDDPAALCLQLAPGTVLIESPHPVATIWHAHRSDAADRFDAVRAARAHGRGESVLVARLGWKVQVTQIEADEARHTAALLAGRTLAAALQAAGDGFDFERWLIAALQRQLLVAVVPASASAPR